ncbi:PLP-dependent cysteine synthase family protein [Occallatibacter riparius]|uniref:cysteine synthase n=1 Tax=Occallatibacter riparius TaxID=1002689 RepID=A0A9J7BXJ8_9BACT|nr:cysteine synthase family protein [Occallatibacter riparius]UWZ85726.1 cysteine synthase family protein [Occallatibacter riparius]
MPSHLEETVTDRLTSLGRLVGNTPLLSIHFSYRGHPRVVYAKCEQMNLTGSIKDRMALHILRKAYAAGELHAGDTIAEATSGNTGIAFAALGRALGHPVTIFMPDWMSRERKDLIRSYGAEVVPVSKEQGGFLGSIRMAEEMAELRDDVFLPQQFSNNANSEAHALGTGPEIWAQLEAARLVPDAFVAGVGTGGTVMGVGQYLRTRNPKIRVHPVEPAESPTLSTGCKVGKHRIQGISDEFIPALMDFKCLDEIIGIPDGDSILMAQKLASALGLAVGISSGCNFLAALKVQEQLGPSAVVVTVFPDDNRKYLSTDLMRDEPVQESYLSPEVQLLGLTTGPRVCAFCDRPM